MASSESQSGGAHQWDICGSIDCGDPRQSPNIILSVSPCRSGTTVLLRVFSAAGVPSYYQPLKNVLRWQLESTPVRWQVPRSPGKTIFVKETIGPYTAAESAFDPLSALLEAGLPSRNLRLFVYARTPRQTWLSWRDCWSSKATLANLAQAFKTTARIEQHARDLAVPVTTAVYEALRDHEPALIVERIFGHLGLPVDRDKIAESVAALPPLADTNRQVIFPREPASFDSWPYLGRAKSSRALCYFHRDEQSLAQQDAEQIRSSRIDALYDVWRRQCENDLGIAIRQKY